MIIFIIITILLILVFAINSSTKRKTTPKNQKTESSVFMDTSINITTNIIKGNEKQIYHKKSKSTIEFTQLLDSVKKIGKEENPLFRRGYETSMPCYDFSLYVRVQLQNNNIDALWDFYQMYYQIESPNEERTSTSQFEMELVERAIQILKRSNPKLDIKYDFDLERIYNDNIENALKNGFDDYDFTEFKSAIFKKPTTIHNDFIKFIQIPLEIYVKTETKAFQDLRSFQLINGSEISHQRRGFWLTDINQTLVLVMSVYDYQVMPNIKILITRANKFLERMRKDVDYWKDYPEFNMTQLKQTYELKVDTDLVEKLKSLGIAERHFFINDFAKSQNLKYWDGLKSTYKTRQMGIYEPSAREKLMALDLFDTCNDLESVLSVYSKGDLKELSENAGFNIKKTWTAQKIYDYLCQSDEGTVFLKGLLETKQILKLKEHYKSDLQRLLAYSEQIQKLVDLFCFV